MPFRKLALLGAAMVFVPTLSLAQAIVDAGDPNEVLLAAQAYGKAELMNEAGRDPRISGELDGVSYQVFFMNCTDNAACEDINFYAGFAGARLTLERINDWNRNNRFGNAYLDVDGDAAIEYDVNLQYGVTSDTLDADFGLWSAILGEFAAYVRQ